MKFFFNNSLIYPLIFLIFFSCNSVRHNIIPQKTTINYDKAEKYFNAAQEKFEEARYQDALELYQKAYDIHKKKSSKLCIKDLANILICHRKLKNEKNVEKSNLKFLELMETMYGPVHEKVSELKNDVARFYLNEENYVKAQDFAFSAVEIDKKIYGPVFNVNKLEHLNTLALIYDKIGAYEKAKSIYENIHCIIQKKYGDNHPNIEAVKNNLGNIYYQLNNYIKAEQYYLNALNISQSSKQKETFKIARNLNNLAVLYKSTDQYAKAEPYYISSINMYEELYGPYHQYVGAAQNNLAGLYLKNKKYEDAEKLLTKALIISEMNKHLELLWHVQDGFRDLYAAQNLINIAIFFGKQSVNTIQKIRFQNLSLDKSLTKSFLKSKISVYKNLANLLIDIGRIAEAQQVIHMLKQEEYYKFMNENIKRGSKIQSLKVPLTESEKKLEKVYIDNILNNACSVGKQYQKSADMARALLKQLEVIRKDFITYLNKIKIDISQNNPDRIDFIDRYKRMDKLQGALEDLGHNAVIIDYLVTSNKLFIILTTPTISKGMESLISYKSLSHNIAQFRNKLLDPTSNYLNEAKKLYQIIFSPVQKYLDQEEAKILMLSIDDILRYIPFATLHDGDSFIIEKYALSIFTPAAGIDIKDLPQKNWSVSALGVSRKIRSFCPLPAVNLELDSIVKETQHLDDDGILPGVVYLNEQFTISALNEAIIRRDPVLHIASHFKFQPGDVDDSFLLLGDGTELTLKMLEENNYNLSKVDLLTLSACETAMGGKNARGKEIESFGVMAQLKGAKSVMATLWQVSDISTGLFMKQFYNVHNTQKMLTKAEVLQQIQISFLNGLVKQQETNIQTRGSSIFHTKTNVPENKINNDINKNYSHPYYWAPFILIGNWL